MLDLPCSLDLHVKRSDGSGDIGSLGEAFGELPKTVTFPTTSNATPGIKEHLQFHHTCSRYLKQTCDLTSTQSNYSILAQKPHDQPSQQPEQWLPKTGAQRNISSLRMSAHSQHAISSHACLSLRQSASSTWAAAPQTPLASSQPATPKPQYQAWTHRRT